MTVGEPEINLNTWGLRYVKKKSDLSAFGDTSAVRGSDPNKTPEKPQKSPQPHSESATSGNEAPTEDKFGNIQTKPNRDIDTTSSYGGAHGNVSNTGSGGDKDANAEKKRLSSPKVGGENQTTTHGSGNKGALTSQGKPTTTDNLPHGSDARSSVDAKTAPTSSGRKEIKYPEEVSTSATPEGTSIGKSSLDLAIIKCQLLKVNIPISKKQTGAKIPAEKLGELPDSGKKGSKESTTTIEDATGKETEVETGFKKWEKEQKQKADEIVQKAVELINEAYGEIEKKHDFIEETRPVRPSHRDDDEEAKKAEGGSSISTSTEGANNPVHNSRNQEVLDPKSNDDRSFGEIRDQEGTPKKKA